MTTSSQPQGDPTADLGSIQTSTSLLLGCNGARNLSQPLTAAAASNHQPSSYHHFPLMNETSVAASSASIISRSSHHHYESHLYGTLAGHQRLKSPSTNAGDQGSTWKRLLSTMMPKSNEPRRGSRSRPSLTLHHGSGLNAENTLRLEAHRQLFQSHDLIRSGGGDDLYRSNLQPQLGSYDATRPLTGHQYFPPVRIYHARNGGTSWICLGRTEDLFFLRRYYADTLKTRSAENAKCR